MNETAFFEAGDDLHRPAGFGFDPGLKGGCVAGFAHGGGRDNADFVDAVGLDGALEAFESLDGIRHGFRRDKTGLEDAGAEASDFAVFMDGAKLVGDDTGDFEPAGVGTNIDGSEGVHGGAASPEPEGSGATIHDEGVGDPSAQGATAVGCRGKGSP